MGALSDKNIEQINEACQRLQNQDVVAMPTETVYGLAAIIDSEVAIKKIFTVKQRPFFDPLIVHVASLEQARRCSADWNELSELLAQTFWPGPLTLVVPKASHISDLITSGLGSVGLRFPAHPLAQRLIAQIGIPLAAPSANKFGRTSPTTPQHVRDEFSDEVFVIESEASQYGIESTVLSVGQSDSGLYQIGLLRPGVILRSQIDRLLKDKKINYDWVEKNLRSAAAPGQMKHHYMPAVPLVICRNPQMKLSELTQILNKKLSELPDEVEGVRIIKPKSEVKKIEFLNLSNQPEQAARELYSQLRSVSQRSPDALCFIQLPVHSGEMWESLFDRLYKAASLVLD